MGMQTHAAVKRGAGIIPCVEGGSYVWSSHYELTNPKVKNMYHGIHGTHGQNTTQSFFRVFHGQIF